MIRLSRLADYGMVLMSHIAAHRDEVHNATGIAAATGVPVPTVSKILQALARDGLLQSHRGAKGGYTLARRAEEIPVASVIRAVDGPIALTLCIEEGPGACDIEPVCPSRHSWQRINDAVSRALEDVSLAEVAMASPPLLPVAKPGSEAAAGSA